MTAPLPEHSPVRPAPAPLSHNWTPAEEHTRKLLEPNLEEKLWHGMREDLARYIPEFADNNLLMCCCCARHLSRVDFDRDHIIPQQALKMDPRAVKDNRDTPANVRAGNLLLCKKPLKVKIEGRLVENGCNSWKGRSYDNAIRELVSGTWKPKVASPVHTIAALCLGYIAMVSEFGYRVVLSRSGKLMREQFFSPFKYHRNLPDINRVLMLGGIDTSLDNPMWAKPFFFRWDEGGCIVVARNFSIRVPCTVDPRLPIAQRLPFAPQKHILRPVFSGPTFAFEA